jgi:serine/threonine protein kinase
MHCDIKEPNIMLKEEDLQEPEAVIIDLGVAQLASVKRTVIYGTPGYIPPEVWEGKNWYPSSDMFSLGVVIVQVLIGKAGIFTENTRTFKDVMKATRARLPPFELMPLEFPTLRWVAENLLAKDPQDRPSADYLLEIPWEPEEDCRKLQRRHSFHSKSLPDLLLESPIDALRKALSTGRDSDRSGVAGPQNHVNEVVKSKPKHGVSRHLQRRHTEHADDTKMDHPLPTATLSQCRPAFVRTSQAILSSPKTCLADHPYPHVVRTSQAILPDPKRCVTNSFPLLAIRNPTSCSAQHA